MIKCFLVKVEERLCQTRDQKEGTLHYRWAETGGKLHNSKVCLQDVKHPPETLVVISRYAAQPFRFVHARKRGSVRKSVCGVCQRANAHVCV